MFRSKRRTILVSSLLAILVLGVLVFAEYGATALIIFGEFVTVPVAAILVVDTKMRGKFSREKGGWWTGIVVDGKKVGIRVDWNSCMGAASCVELAPKVFHLDWEKRKSVFDPAPLEVLDEKGDAPDKIFFAAQSCPYKAIILEDEVSGEQIFP
jgi:ferredoxin